MDKNMDNLIGQWPLDCPYSLLIKIVLSLFDEITNWGREFH